MKTLLKVDTWLPVFSGFYETIWETDNDEEMELDDINKQREENKLPAITWDDVDWDYNGREETVAQMVTETVTEELQRLKCVQDGKYQKLVSPRAYNFTNDSVDVQFVLSEENIETICVYLTNNNKAFEKYLERHYTSYDGFISSYSNTPEDWRDDLQATLQDKHKLGSILQFILLNENGPEYEMDIWEDTQGNGGHLTAKNYDKLTKGA